MPQSTTDRSWSSSSAWHGAALASCIVLAQSFVPSNADEPPSDWWVRASEEIVRSEYRVRNQPHGIRSDEPGGLHAANRAQNMRACFRADGIEWMQRSVTHGSWKLRLVLADAGFGELSADGDRVIYRRNEVTEEWTNTPAGFSLLLRPTGAHEGGTFTASYDLSTDLEGIVSSAGNVVGFYRNGAAIVTLRPLRNDGRLKISLAGRQLHLDYRLLDDGSHQEPSIRLLLEGFAPVVGQPLSLLPQWFVEANQSSAMLGAAVASAGDVNGDGFSDLIVGAPRFDGGQLDEGRVLLYLGGADGPSTIPVWTAESDEVEARFGESVSAAGDVNGDGFGDVIVGAPGFSVSADQAEEGRVEVYLGSGSGPAMTRQWTADGSDPSGRLGSSVAWAGDVNGDGYDDVIVGARFFDNDQVAEGRAWVYGGSPTGISAVLWSGEGDQDFAEFGASVAAAGDVDGDGFGDVIVGAPGIDGDEGRASVFFGPLSGALRRWDAPGGEAAAAFGSSVSTAGDVNGDGYSDVIVGAPFYGTPSRGRVSVFRGSPNGPEPNPWTADCDQDDALFGASVSTAGDVNGDGYADVVVGAPLFDGVDTDEGLASVYLGSASGLADSPAWTAGGAGHTAHLGESVAAAGDLNGDGFGDVIVGAPQLSNMQSNEGRAFVYVGAGAGPALSPAWTFEGDRPVALLGGAIGSAGDVNGDGFSDLIVGANLYANGEDGEGAAFVFHGSGSATGLSTTPDWCAEGNASGANFGEAVAAAGDVNGDGFGDIVVGAPRFSGSGNDEGRVSLFLGSASGIDACPGGSPDWTFDGNEINAELGTSVAGAGDVNGDGFADVIVGAPQSRVGGQVFVFLGSPSGFDPTPWSGESDVPAARFGAAVAGAGDVNGDGFGDIVVGAPGLVDDQALGGRVFVFLGSGAGLSRSPAWTADGAEPSCSLGVSVASAGDVTGDGFSDLILGATCETISPFRGGRAFFYAGSGAGLGLSPVWIVDGDQTDSAFGGAVAGIGDVNGDGFGDVVVGAPDYRVDFDREGRASAYLGSPDGPETTPAWTVVGGRTDARYGFAVAGAGDVNGDGFGDVGIGARFFGDMFQGSAFAYLGNGGGGPDRPLRQLAMQEPRPIGPRGRSDSETGFRVEALARSAAGRSAARLELEVKPLGRPFDGAGTVAGPETDTGPPDGSGSDVLLEQIVDDLSPGTFYRWRARLLTNSPLFPRTRWSSLPSNDISETKLRTDGSLPAPELAPVGPGINETVFPDSSPLRFSWNGGGLQRFRLEWSRNPEFVFATEIGDEIEAEEGGDIQVHLPDTESWRRILRLARSPEIREIPIFWRIVSVDGGTVSATRTIRMATARPPQITSPVDGAEFETTQPPLLSWTANHNERYQIRFSTVPFLAPPRVIASPDYGIDVTDWILPPDIWSQVIELSLGSADGIIYYAVFARDALDRTTWSQVRTLRVLPGSGQEPATTPARRWPRYRKGHPSRPRVTR